MTAPVVFISYSHDTAEHKRWVLDLGIRLRSSGVDAILDQWDLGTGGDLPQFMEQSIRRSSKIVMVCTRRYVEKANSGTGGVGYEKMIVTAEFLSSIGSTAIIPVVRQNGASKILPTFLQTKRYVDLSTPEVFESGIDELLRHILNAPLYIKPPIGNDPFNATPQPSKQRALTPVEQFMTAVADLYPRAGAESALRSEWIRDQMKTSNLLFRYAFDQAQDQELVWETQNHEIVYITAKGRAYLVESLNPASE